MLFQTATGVMKAATPGANLFTGEQLPSAGELTAILMHDATYSGLVSQRDELRGRLGELRAKEEELRSELRKTPKSKDPGVDSLLSGGSATVTTATLPEELRDVLRQIEVTERALGRLEQEIQAARSTAADGIREQSRALHERINRRRATLELVLARINGLENDLYRLGQATGIGAMILSHNITPGMGGDPDPAGGARQRLREAIRVGLLSKKDESQVIAAAEKAPLLVD